MGDGVVLWVASENLWVANTLRRDSELVGPIVMAHYNRNIGLKDRWLW